MKMGRWKGAWLCAVLLALPAQAALASEQGLLAAPVAQAQPAGEAGGRAQGLMKNKSYAVDEVQRIELVSDVLDVEVKASLDENVHVRGQLREGQRGDYAAQLKGKKLTLTDFSKAQFNKIILELPPGPKLALHITTDTGNITVSGGSFSQLKADTQTGSIYISAPHVYKLAANSQAGDVTANCNKLSSAVVKTQTGDIILVTQAPKPTLKATSTTGDATVTIPEKPSVQYRLYTQTGSRTLDGKNINEAGKFGKGEGHVEIRLSTGNAKLLRK